jgi:hypothetical protein
MKLTIDALNPMILKSYRANVLGRDGSVFDIEFQSLYHATSWAETCEIQDRVWLRDDSLGLSFSFAVVVQFDSEGL